MGDQPKPPAWRAARGKPPAWLVARAAQRLNNTGGAGPRPRFAAGRSRARVGSSSSSSAARAASMPGLPATHRARAAALKNLANDPELASTAPSSSLSSPSDISAAPPPPQQQQQQQQPLSSSADNKTQPQTQPPQPLQSQPGPQPSVAPQAPRRRGTAMPKPTSLTALLWERAVSPWLPRISTSIGSVSAWFGFEAASSSSNRRRTAVVGGVTLGAILWISWKLWKSRQETAGASSGQGAGAEMGVGDQMEEGEEAGLNGSSFHQDQVATWVAELAEAQTREAKLFALLRYRMNVLSGAFPHWEPLSAALEEKTAAGDLSSPGSAGRSVYRELEGRLMMLMDELDALVAEVELRRSNLPVGPELLHRIPGTSLSGSDADAVRAALEASRSIPHSTGSISPGSTQSPSSSVAEPVRRQRRPPSSPTLSSFSLSSTSADAMPR